MGLPTKQQKKKHTRGARKALETLEMLNSESDVSGKALEETKKSEEKHAVKKKHEETNKLQPIQEEPCGEEAIANVAEPLHEKPIVEEAVVSKSLNKNTDTKPSPAVDGIAGSSEAEYTKVRKKSAEESDSEIDSIEDTQADKYLTFQLGNTDFGFEIKFVTEIIVIQKITAVPDTSQFIKGVINLRGKVIPVMDIRERFGLEPRKYDDRTCIIVVNCEDVSVGLIVDTVNEVADIPVQDIDPPPMTHTGIETEYIVGMGRIKESVKVLLNLKNVLEINGTVLQVDGYSENQEMSAG